MSDEEVQLICDETNELLELVSPDFEMFDADAITLACFKLIYEAQKNRISRAEIMRRLRRSWMSFEEVELEKMAT